MKCNSIIILLNLLFSFLANAQQNAQFSDYKINMSSFNPAFAGYYDGSILLIHRSQFTGIEGAPETQNLNINVPISIYMGTGFNLINENLGVTQKLIATADYSYTIYTNDYNMITFGLKGGISNLNVNYSRLDLGQGNDVSFENNINNLIRPRIGVGFLYNAPSWFVGLSTPNFIKEIDDPSIKSTPLTTNSEFYLITGFLTTINNNLLFKPSILAKKAKNEPFVIDLALNFELQGNFRFGVSYRWDNAITATVGINFMENFQAGFTYDRNINGLGAYAPSSNQFYLKYVFKHAKDIRRDNFSFTSPTNNIGF
ncbi:type IX secretion system membrane protein PorP/SprF [Flavobacterium sp. AC]|uniref:Type IX secretion system membrane protein PorP/SprF n=1 Tax=Flavobacterium azizsancarii TaxID=2961580 RepID=A0ABT4WLX1_9FLAO|nr:type IX secretion system membrane protein PorP/SprF [Flavobacterium azizsancarii]MDA6072820.1 type IX secretion system membrane protein PorP/SprF [Flavobacterium azizsancarii]